MIDAANRRQVAGDDVGADWLLDENIRPVLAGDKIAALGVTEPDGGSDVVHLRTRAIPDGDDWIINGAKTYITSGCALMSSWSRRALLTRVHRASACSRWILRCPDSRSLENFGRWAGIAATPPSWRLLTFGFHRMPC